MTVAPADMEFVRELVRSTVGLSLGAGKEYLVEFRLGALARAEGRASIEELVRVARSDPALRKRISDAMSTGETSFFRDGRPFDALRERVLPELAETLPVGAPIRIWSAACSTGQEPYSLAMLVDRHPEAAGGRPVRILASDSSSEALEAARRGVFTQLEVNRGLPAPLLLRYFTRRGRRWAVQPELNARVRFVEHNLLDDWGRVPRPHVLWLRNVLLYFDTPLKQRILERVGRHLHPGGYLFLGAAETVLGLSEEFEPIATHGTVVFRLRPPEGVGR